MKVAELPYEGDPRPSGSPSLLQLFIELPELGRGVNDLDERLREDRPRELAGLPRDVKVPRRSISPAIIVMLAELSS